jgi:hypothetical protein
MDWREQVGGQAGYGQQYGDCEREGETPPAHGGHEADEESH